MKKRNNEDAPDIFDRIMAWRLLRPLQPFYQKYKEPLLYLFFGGLTLPDRTADIACPVLFFVFFRIKGCLRYSR